MVYLVKFYDANQSGNVEHNELYSTLKSAERRFDYLQNHLNCYSWVYLFDTVMSFGRIRQGKCLDGCSSCDGKDNYYHGDDSDF